MARVTTSRRDHSHFCGSGSPRTTACSVSWYALMLPASLAATSAASPFPGERRKRDQGSRERGALQAGEYDDPSGSCGDRSRRAWAESPRRAGNARHGGYRQPPTCSSGGKGSFSARRSNARPTTYPAREAVWRVRVPDTPFSSTGPISANITGVPWAASTTSWLTRTSPGLADSAILAAMFTVRPK